MSQGKGNHFYCMVWEALARLRFVLNSLKNMEICESDTDITVFDGQWFYSRFSDIFWIDASSESVIDLRLRQIAQANNGSLESTLSAASVLKWISQKTNWLMIYDNADAGHQVVEKFIPPGNGGNILITSRNSELMIMTKNSMEVLKMGEGEAWSLLLQHGTDSYIMHT